MRHKSDIKTKGTQERTIKKRTAEEREKSNSMRDKELKIDKRLQHIVNLGDGTVLYKMEFISLHWTLLKLRNTGREFNLNTFLMLQNTKFFN